MDLCFQDYIFWVEPSRCDTFYGQVYMILTLNERFLAVCLQMFHKYLPLLLR